MMRMQRQINMSRWCVLVVWVAVAFMGASGCGDDESSSSSTPTDTGSGDSSSSGTDSSSSGTDSSSSGTDSSSSGTDSSSGGTTSVDAETSSGVDTTLPPTCGNGVLDSGEQCDDNNTASGDGCAADCTIEAVQPVCGDGLIRTDVQVGAPGYEECDDANTNPGDGCDGNCQLEGNIVPGCGNGVRELNEQCDDGNALNDDACIACQDARCGDGLVRGDITDNTDPAFESCDDGNGVVQDACPDGAFGTCRAAACGDGFLLATSEQCDDGNLVSGDGCDSICNVEGTNCGNGVVDGGEFCDLGANNSNTAAGDCPAVCRTDCNCPSCGDAVVDLVQGEECDDGNAVSGDGCDSSCAREAPSTCGDGVLDIITSEQCDDGNGANGDGCSDTCRFELVGQLCGNSVVDPGEACDDGNTVNGDNCSATCNFTTATTTLLSNLPGNPRGLAADDRYLWLGECDPTGANRCGISRVDLGTCLSGGACTPTLVAGGTCGPPVDGTGTGAVLSCVESLTSDGTTVWFGNQHTLRALDIASGVVTTIAGNTARCGAIDGVGTNAFFHDLRGVTYDGGYVYLLDSCENVLRRFDIQTQAVVTLAGTRVPDPSVPQSGANAYQCPTNFACTGNPGQDGFGLAADFESPRYMTSDRAGTLYITDTNGEAMRTYNLTNGWVGTLIRGTGYQDGLNTVGSPVLLQRPRGVTSDGTSIYWNEQTAHTVRQTDVITGETSTFVGARGCAGGQDGFGGLGSAGINCGALPATQALIDTPFGGITYHFPSRSILLLEGTTSIRLRQIQ